MPNSYHLSATTYSPSCVTGVGVGKPGPDASGVLVGVGVGVTWVGIEPSGHWPFIDQTDPFVRRLLAFLERISIPKENH